MCLLLILDSGTTTLELAKLLDKSVIVITNDPLISHVLLYNEKITLFSTGGKLRRDHGCAYISSDVTRMLENYHAHKCFLGTSALDFEQGLMVFSSEESDIKRAIMKASDRAICLIDYSKFHQTAFSTFARLGDLDAVVTDARILAQDTARLEAAGIEVLIS